MPFPSTTTMPGTQQPPCTHLTWNRRRWVLLGCRVFLSYIVLCWEPENGQGQEDYNKALPETELVVYSRHLISAFSGIYI